MRQKHTNVHNTTNSRSRSSKHTRQHALAQTSRTMTRKNNALLRTPHKSIPHRGGNTSQRRNFIAGARLKQLSTPQQPQLLSHSTPLSPYILRTMYNGTIKHNNHINTSRSILSPTSIESRYIQTSPTREWFQYAQYTSPQRLAATSNGPIDYKNTRPTNKLFNKRNNKNNSSNSREPQFQRTSNVYFGSFNVDGSGKGRFEELRGNQHQQGDLSKMNQESPMTYSYKSGVIDNGKPRIEQQYTHKGRLSDIRLGTTSSAKDTNNNALLSQSQSYDQNTQTSNRDKYTKTSYSPQFGAANKNGNNAQSTTGLASAASSVIDSNQPESLVDNTRIRGRFGDYHTQAPASHQKQSQESHVESQSTVASGSASGGSATLSDRPERAVSCAGGVCFEHDALHPDKMSSNIKHNKLWGFYE